MTDTTTPPEMPKPDTWVPLKQTQGRVWEVRQDGTTAIERAYGELQRFAAEKAADAERLREALQDAVNHLSYVHNELVTTDQDTTQGLRNLIANLHEATGRGVEKFSAALTKETTDDTTD